MVDGSVGLKSHRVNVYPAISLIIPLALCLLGPGCNDTGKQLNLHDRITSAQTDSYCHLPDACFNPHVLASENGYYVTTFLGSKPQHAHVSAEALASYLESLPIQVWPRGAVIEMSPSDDVIDGKAVQRNLAAAERLCRSMGLDVQVLPGG